MLFAGSERLIQLLIDKGCFLLYTGACTLIHVSISDAYVCLSIDNNMIDVF